MKRLLSILIISFTVVFPLLAYTDSFAEMQSDPVFLDLLEVVKNGKSEAEAQEAYEAYVAAVDNPLYLSRMEYHMVRYYMDMGNEEMAQVHLDRQLAYLDQIPENTSEFMMMAAEADASSSEYYVTGNLGAGMDNNSQVKKMYKEYPDEFYAAVQEGFRLYYAPHIAGGSQKRALKLFNEIEADMDGISYLDHYSLLMGKAMALSARKQYEESNRYLDAAYSIYTFDKAYAEIREDNAKGLD